MLKRIIYGVLAANALGVVCFAGAVIYGSANPRSPAADGQTELDRKLAANTKRISEACGKYYRGKDHAADREYDLARGIRTGAMSASEVRQAAGTLAATREYMEDGRQECEAAKAEGAELGAQAQAVYHASEEYRELAASTESSPPHAAAKKPASKKVAAKAHDAPKAATSVASR